MQTIIPVTEQLSDDELNQLLDHVRGVIWTRKLANSKVIYKNALDALNAAKERCKGMTAYEKSWDHSWTRAVENFDEAVKILEAANLKAADEDRRQSQIVKLNEIIVKYGLRSVEFDVRADDSGRR